MFKHLVAGDEEGAETTQKFYEEYRSVCDMTAEFYLQTVDVVFQQHQLPKGEMEHRGRLVRPDAIRDTALLAIEGERDDISGVAVHVLMVRVGLRWRIHDLHKCRLHRRTETSPSF